VSKRAKPQRQEKKNIPPEASQKPPLFQLRHLIAFGLILGVALVAYSNTFDVPFQFDDRPNITLNPNVQIKVLTWDRFERLAKGTFKETIRVFSYLTLALNYYLGGTHVFGYHVFNLVVHVAAGFFLYLFITLTFHLPSLRERYGAISYKVALFASLIFISHPVQTQAVTYIVQRMASMAAMFYLLSMVLYVKGRLSSDRSRFFYFGGMVLSYVLGVLSKENAAVLPFFIALYEFYFIQNFDLGPRGKRVVSILLGSLLLLGALGFVFLGNRYIADIVEVYPSRNFTMLERVLTQFRVVLYYVTLLAYPHPSRLNLDYDFPISRGVLDPPTTLISILVVALLIGYGLWVAKKRPVVSFCILWYFGNLVIESSIFPLELAFEHRLYLPSVGPFILFSLLAVRGIERLIYRRQGLRVDPASADRG
jgi:protein O-mannosyl-transferase